MAETKAYGSLGKSPQGPVGSRGAMQAAAGHNPKVLKQAVTDVRVVMKQKVKRNNSGPLLFRVGAKEPDTRQDLDIFHKPPDKTQLFFPDGRNPFLN